MSLIRTRLSVMMFLEFLIWGAWYPLIFGYLPEIGFSSNEQTAALACFNIAAIVAMFFSTQFADRNFAAEKFVAFSHLVGGVAMLLLGGISFLGIAPIVKFWPFFGLMLIHCLFYVPTISITNSIAFANVKDPQKDFGLVRLWGTIGWIAASWPFVFLLVDWAGVQAKLSEAGSAVPWWKWLGIVLGTPKVGEAFVQATTYTFTVAGLASLALAAFSLFLPHTPPKPAAAGESQFAWLEAAKLLAIPFMFVLFIVTFLDATVHQFYFVWCGRYLMSIGIPGNWVMPAMSVGQFAEIGTMAVLGLFLKRLGWRWTMTIGILGHAVRFAVFALVPFAVPAVIVQVLHGICYAFFFATVYIFVDEFFPKDVRSSAQGLFNLLILGLGPLLGNYAGPKIGEMLPNATLAAAVKSTAEGRDVVISGFVKYPPTGNLQKLMIKEPGSSEPHERHVSVNEQNRFELPLGPAKSGTYSVSMPIVRRRWLAGDQPTTLAAPDLVVGNVAAGGTPQTFAEGVEKIVDAAGQAPLPSVQASDIDFQRLFLIPSGTAVIAALLLIMFFRPPVRAVTDVRIESA